jgi:hypothetical protein
MIRCQSLKDLFYGLNQRIHYVYHIYCLTWGLSPEMVKKVIIIIDTPVLLTLYSPDVAQAFVFLIRNVFPSFLLDDI